MDIKNLKGTVSFTDCVDALVTGSGSETLGALWEKSVDCNHCTYLEQCRALAEVFEDITCSQVIDYLLGEQNLT